MKIFKNSKFFLLILFSLLSLAALLVKPIYAREIVGECETTEECREMAQDPRAICDNHVCLIPPSVPSYLEKYQEELDNCVKTGTTNLTCWVGNTAEVNTNGTLGVTGNILNSFLSMLTGPQISGGSSSLSSNRPQGAIAGITSLITTLYVHPPASSGEYFADLGKNFGLIKPVYAQGVGFTRLKPILPVWKAMRDVAYFFFVLVFITIGLAIMFRVKIDPKTVISLQNSIPRIVIALILVTFSYAIAGLIIDLMYLFTAIALTAITPSSTGLIEKIISFIKSLPFEPLRSFTEALAGTRENPNLLGFSLFFLGKGIGFAETIARAFNPVTLTAELINLPNFVVQALQKTTSFNIGIAGTILSLVLIIVLLFAFFKVFFSLLMAYIQIILAIIFAPLQIMLYAIPGQNTFGSWLRNLIANIAVFPTIIILMAITSAIVAGAQGGEFWLPPIISPPLIGTSSRIVTAIIAYGMLLIMPKAAEMVKAAFKMGEPVSYGTAIGKAMGPITGPWNVAKAGVTKGVVGGVGKLISSRFPGQRVAETEVSNEEAEKAERELSRRG